MLKRVSLFIAILLVSGMCYAQDLSSIFVKSEEVIVKDNKHILLSTIEQPISKVQLEAKRAGLVKQRGIIDTQISKIDQMLMSIAAKPLDIVKE